MIIKTQHLVDGARRDNYKPACYYLRGLQPKPDTTPIRGLYWGAYGLGQGNQFQGWQGHIVMYTDGSRGPILPGPKTEEMWTGMGS
eukprot:12093976-Karenia_brevis.AAC.1